MPAGRTQSVYKELRGWLTYLVRSFKVQCLGAIFALLGNAHGGSDVGLYGSSSSWGRPRVWQGGSPQTKSFGTNSHRQRCATRLEMCPSHPPLTPSAEIGTKPESGGAKFEGGRSCLRAPRGPGRSGAHASARGCAASARGRMQKQQHNHLAADWCACRVKVWSQYGMGILECNRCDR